MRRLGELRGQRGPDRLAQGVAVVLGGEAQKRDHVRRQRGLLFQDPGDGLHLGAVGLQRLRRLPQVEAERVRAAKRDEYPLPGEERAFQRVGDGVGELAPDRTPDEYPESYREIAHAIDLAEGDEDWDEVNTLEAWLWLDGPSARDGRVGGAARRLFLDMNGRALVADPIGEEDRSTNAWERLEQVAVPTLVVVGELDYDVSTANAVTAAQRIPGAELVRLPDAAHLPVLEENEACLKAIVQFVAAHH